MFSKLFGTKAKKEPSPEVYNGYSIFAEPMKESGGYRIAARVEKEIDGELKSHQLIRADTISNLEAAQEASVGKAKQLIDQIGDALFQQDR